MTSQSLRDQAAVNHWFRANRPEFVFLVAGTVGGIFANSTRPAEFIYDNMMIHATVVHSAHLFGVKKLLYLGSSCIYPREASQPMKEEVLLMKSYSDAMHIGTGEDVSIAGAWPRRLSAAPAGRRAIA